VVIDDENFRGGRLAPRTLDSRFTNSSGEANAPTEAGR
jgi:hypothetical protein